MTKQGEPIPAPPAGEDIHMPEPSVIPLLNAVGVALAIIGVTFSWWVTGVGLLIFFVTTVRWVRDTRRDISELPLHHHEGAH